MAALTDEDLTSCITMPQDGATRYNLLLYRNFITAPEKFINLKLSVRNISSCNQAPEFIAYFLPEVDRAVCDKLRYCALSADETNEFAAECTYKCPCVGNRCRLTLLMVPLFKENATFCEVEV